VKFQVKGQGFRVQVIMYRVKGAWCGFQGPVRLWACTLRVCDMHLALPFLDLCDGVKVLGLRA
jgi:hypothetical protein